MKNLVNNKRFPQKAKHVKTLNKHSTDDSVTVVFIVHFTLKKGMNQNAKKIYLHSNTNYLYR